MKHFLPVFIARYWIAVAVLFFTLLSAYTSSPMYGQAATPTPDVNTVPPIEMLATPTNTPFPTPTPIDDDDQSGGGGLIPATATPVSDGNENGGSNTGGNNNDGGNSAPDNGGGGNSSENGHDTSNNNSGGSGNTSSGGQGGTGSAESSGTTTTTSLGRAADGYAGVVNVVTLNVRRLPSTNSPIVDTLFIHEPVTIIARDNSNSWWYVCCGSGSGREGWVSAQFITPSFASADAETLLPITATTTEKSANGENAGALVVEMRPSPAFAWQGQRVQLQFTVRNLSDQPLTQIRLRNDLPPTLTYIDTAVDATATVQKNGQSDEGLIYTIQWPALEAGGTVTATVTVQIADDLPNGAMVDNLAAVDSAEGATALAGITFAMPPLRLPVFR